MKSLGNVLSGILLAAVGLFASSEEVRREPIKGELRSSMSSTSRKWRSSS